MLSQRPLTIINFWGFLRISTLQPQSKIFVAINDENSHLFLEEILKEADFFFEKQQAVNQDENIPSNEDEPMYVDTTSQRFQVINTFNNVYANSPILEGELSSE